MGRCRELCRLKERIFSHILFNGEGGGNGIEKPVLNWDILVGVGIGGFTWGQGQKFFSFCP